MSKTRTSQLVKALRDARISALLISNLTNIRYLTGIDVSSGLLLVMRRRVVLFVDSRYIEVASKRAERDYVVADPSDLHKYLVHVQDIGFEPNDVTVARLQRWKKQLKNKKFVHTKDLVEGLRRIKAPDELHSIAAACALTKKALTRVPSMLRFGMTERQLASDLFMYCMKGGAERMAFDTIVGFGENTSKPHHKPSNRRLKKGDIVQIDMGAMIDGYCSDYSRVYFTGQPTAEQAKAYAALKEAKKSSEKILKQGVLNTTLDAEARRVLKLHGYDKEFSHSLGHGVGMDIHEGTTLSMKAPPTKLLKNEVITIEPGLYFPGRWGMRLEDTRIVGHPDF